MPASILIVDDEKHTREGLRQALEDEYDVYLASDADEAFNWMEIEEFDVILTDLRMAGKSGMSVIDKAISLPKQDRKSTRLNSSHVAISYAVFCLKKKRATDQR